MSDQMLAPPFAAPAIPTDRIGRIAAAVGLPLLLAIVYGNLSDLAMRNLSTPSVVQPLVALLAVAIVLARHRVEPLSVLLTPLAFLLAAYCALLLASSTWAIDAAASDARTIEAFKDFAIAMTAACLCVSWRTLRNAIVAVVGMAAFLALLTIVQHLLGTGNEFFGFASLQEASVVGNRFEARASGPIDEPNFYAQMLLIAIPLAVGLAATARTRLRRGIAAAAALLIASGMALTYSRGAMVALIATSGLSLVFVRPRPRHVAAAVAIAALVLVVLPADVRERFVTMTDVLPQKSGITERDASIEKRSLLYKVSIAEFEDHPIFGVGAGNFYRHFAHEANLIGSSAPQYEDPSNQELPHSLYLEVASETGLVGLAIFLGTIATALAGIAAARRLLIRRSDPFSAAITTAVGMSFLAYLISALFLHSGFPRPFWILMAYVAGACRLAFRGQPDAEAA